MNCIIHLKSSKDINNTNVFLQTHTQVLRDNLFTQIYTDIVGIKRRSRVAQ